MNPFLEWLASVDTTTRDVIIVLMGFCVVFVVRHLYKQLESEKKLRKELQDKYHALDTLVFFLSKHHQKETGTPLVKESRTSAGDYGLDRSA